MSEIIARRENLPDNIEDLSRFVLVGREKLTAVRAEIRAIDKVGLAENVRQQKLQEAQQISEAVLDAEVRIGELMSQMPARANQFKENKLPNGGEVKTKTEIVREIGLDPKHIDRFEVMAAHPEIVEQAKAEARENDDIVSRSLVLNMIKEKKQNEKRQQIQDRIQEQIDRPKTSNHVDIFTTSKAYRVIYADPPWSYNDKMGAPGMGGAVNHYPTMPLEDICALPVPADKNAVLFLWTTSPQLEDSFKVINAWGFKYKSSFIWDKVAHGMGHYNSVRHEFLLIAVKGNCVPDVQVRPDSVISIERTEHSKKPATFRNLIDTLYPVGNRLEMFAREAPDGWDVWGNMA